MKCEACGLEMVIYRRAIPENGTAPALEYSCRNRRCIRFDQRMKPEMISPEANAQAGGGDRPL